MQHAVHTDTATFAASSADGPPDQKGEAVSAVYAEELIAGSSETTLRDLFNNQLDLVFQFSEITEEDQKKFSEALPEELKKLAELFKPEFNTFLIKEMIAGDLHLSLSTAEALDLLKKIDKDLLTATGKRFLKYLCADFDKLTQKAVKLFSGTGLSHEAFTAAMTSILQEFADVQDISAAGPVSLVGLMCDHHSYINVNIAVKGSFSDMFAQSVANYELLQQQPLTGPLDSFEEALQAFDLIAPIYEQMNASMKLRTKKPASLALRGGATVSDQTVLSVFAGQYSQVPDDQPAGPPCPELITNLEGFRQLSDDKKAKVYGFLGTYRNHFNMILGQMAKRVIETLRSSLPAKVVRDAFESNNSISPTSTIGTNARQTIQKIRALMQDYDVSNVKGAIDFIIREYIPLVKQFGINTMTQNPGFASEMMIYRNGPLKILGVADRLSGRGVTPQPAEKETVYVTQYLPAAETMYGGASEQPALFDGGDQSSSASTAKNYVDQLIAGQKTFNKAYESIYRKLITAISNVHIQSTESINYRKYYTLCELFDNIAIRDPETSVYISGYYGAKNYNPLYLDTVTNALNFVTSSGLNGLNDIKSVLEELKKLLETSAKHARELRAVYAGSSKSVSEIIAVTINSIKQKCMLTNKDFIEMQDAIKRLQATVVGFTQPSVAKDNRAHVEDFVNDAANRDKVIMQHYNTEISAIKQLFIGMDAVRSQYDQQAVTLWTNIIAQKRDAMMYLNSVVDTALSRERLKQIEHIDLNKEQVERVEKLIISYRNTKSTEEYTRRMKKIAKLLERPDISGAMKIVKHLRKLVNITGYVEFIALIHRELGIMSDGFDWNKFKAMLTNLIVFSSIKISRNVSVNGQTMSVEAMLHKICTDFETYCRTYTIRDEHGHDNKWMNAGYNFLMEFFRNNYTKTLPKLEDFDVLTSTHNAAVTFNPASLTNPSTVAAGTAVFKTTVGDADIVGNIVTMTAGDHDYITGGGHLFYEFGGAAALATTGTRANEVPHQAAKLLTKIHDYYGTTYGATAYTDATNPIYVHNLIVFTRLLGHACICPAGGVGDAVISKYLVGANPGYLRDAPGYSIGLGAPSNELQFAMATVDAMFANVFNMMDRYWALRYQGSLDIPLGVSQLLRGGDKLEGANFFDALPLHDPTHGNVIPEAAPFYVCAFHTCYHYISHFGKKRSDVGNDVGEFIMKVPKISVLRPVYDIFKKYKANLDTITHQQVKIALACFNELWLQTSGTDAARLSRAVDLLFNELNGCFIFTSGLQYDIMKITKNVTKASLDIINDKVDTLVKHMQSAISDAVVTTGEPLDVQDKHMEDILGDTYRRIKGERELQRISTLKKLLTQHNENDQLHEYYKFMDLVVTPLLISGKSYGELFRLFDSVTGGSEINAKVDLSKMWINYTGPDFVMVNTTIWDLVQRVRNGQHELKLLLADHPSVFCWNRVLLNIALAGTHTSGRFVMPKFWLIMDENTWPDKPTIEGKTVRQHVIGQQINTMRAIWPEVNGRTVADYYNQCITEYVADYDHFVHNFLSYPGLSDRTIKEVAKVAHDVIKLGPLTPEGVRSIERGVNAETTEQTNTTAAALAQIPVTKSQVYLAPPPYPINSVIPSVQHGREMCESLRFEDIAMANVNVSRIGTTNVCIATKALPQDVTSIYTWVDWVVYQIAKCNSITYRLPYRLIQMFQDYPSIVDFIRPGGYDREGKIRYDTGDVNERINLVTQNLITRSMQDVNQSTVEWSTLNPTWLGSLVATIPYIINTVRGAMLSMEKTISYANVNVTAQLGDLVSLLTIAYDEMSNFAPFIGFMSNSVVSTTKFVQPFAKLLKLVSEGDLTTFAASDFLQLEWANMHFFNIESISYPEYKSRDRFEWLKTYAGDKIETSLFRSMFETTIQTLGRNAWAGLIAKTGMESLRQNFFVDTIDKFIMRIINTMSECDTGIIEQYVNNVLNEISGSASRVHTLAGGMRGGNQLNADVEMSTEIPPYIARALQGIVSLSEKTVIPEPTTYVNYSRALNVGIPPADANKLAESRVLTSENVISKLNITEQERQQINDTYNDITNRIGELNNVNYDHPVLGPSSLISNAQMFQTTFVGLDDPTLPGAYDHNVTIRALLHNPVIVESDNNAINYITTGGPWNTVIGNLHGANLTKGNAKIARLWDSVLINFTNVAGGAGVVQQIGIPALATRGVDQTARSSVIDLGNAGAGLGARTTTPQRVTVGYLMDPANIGIYIPERGGIDNNQTFKDAISLPVCSTDPANPTQLTGDIRPCWANLITMGNIVNCIHGTTETHNEIWTNDIRLGSAIFALVAGGIVPENICGEGRAHYNQAKSVLITMNKINLIYTTAAVCGIFAAAAAAGLRAAANHVTNMHAAPAGADTIPDNWADDGVLARMLYVLGMTPTEVRRELQVISTAGTNAALPGNRDIGGNPSHLPPINTAAPVDVVGADVPLQTWLGARATVNCNNMASAADHSIDGLLCDYILNGRTTPNPNPAIVIERCIKFGLIAASANGAPFPSQMFPALNGKNRLPVSADVVQDAAQAFIKDDGSVNTENNNWFVTGSIEHYIASYIIENNIAWTDAPTIMARISTNGEVDNRLFVGYQSRVRDIPFPAGHRNISGLTIYPMNIVATDPAAAGNKLTLPQFLVGANPYRPHINTEELPETVLTIIHINGTNVQSNNVDTLLTSASEQGVALTNTMHYVRQLGRVFRNTYESMGAGNVQTVIEEKNAWIHAIGRYSAIVGAGYVEALKHAFPAQVAQIYDAAGSVQLGATYDRRKFSAISAINYRLSCKRPLTPADAIDLALSKKKLQRYLQETKPYAQQFLDMLTHPMFRVNADGIVRGRSMLSLIGLFTVESHPNFTYSPLRGNNHVQRDVCQNTIRRLIYFANIACKQYSNTPNGNALNTLNQACHDHLDRIINDASLNTPTANNLAACLQPSNVFAQIYDRLREIALVPEFVPKLVGGLRGGVAVHGILDLIHGFTGQMSQFLGAAYGLARYIHTRAVYEDNTLDLKSKVNKRLINGAVLSTPADEAWKLYYNPNVIENFGNKRDIAINTIANYNGFIVDPANDFTGNVPALDVTNLCTSPTLNTNPADNKEEFGIDWEKFWSGLCELMADCPKPPASGGDIVLSTAGVGRPTHYDVVVEHVRNKLRREAEENLRNMLDGKGKGRELALTNYASRLLTPMVFGDYMAGGDLRNLNPVGYAYATNTAENLFDTALNVAIRAVLLQSRSIVGRHANENSTCPWVENEDVLHTKVTNIDNAILTIPAPWNVDARTTIAQAVHRARFMINPEQLYTHAGAGGEWRNNHGRRDWNGTYIRSRTYDVDSQSIRTVQPRFTAVGYYINGHQRSSLTPHRIHLPEAMLTYVPMTHATLQYLNSPQKDIYNVTLSHSDAVFAPTIVYNPRQTECNTVVSRGYIDRINDEMEAANACAVMKSPDGVSELNDGVVPGGAGWTGPSAVPATRAQLLPNGEIDIVQPMPIGDYNVTTTMHTLLDKLVKFAVDSVIGESNKSKQSNFGFKNVASLTGGLIGGALTTDKWVNTSGTLNGTDTSTILASAYNFENPQAPPKQLYRLIFKNSFGDNAQDYSKYIFGLVVNYFHKHNISFNAIYNSICYPSILFNAAVNRSTMSKISKIANNVREYVTSYDKSSRASDYKLIENFLGAISMGDKSTIDFSDYRTQICFLKNDTLGKLKDYRKSNMLINDIVEGTAPMNGPNANTYRLLYTANQYTSPSIINSFFAEFVEDITIAQREGDKKQLEPAQQLFASGIATGIRHINSLSSILYVMFLLLRQTSYYDNQYDIDRTFFNVESPEPFAAD